MGPWSNYAMDPWSPGSHAPIWAHIAPNIFCHLWAQRGPIIILGRTNMICGPIWDHVGLTNPKMRQTSLKSALPVGLLLGWENPSHDQMNQSATVAQLQNAARLSADAAQAPKGHC